MMIRVVIHAAEEGGFWAEVPSLAGCVSEGENADETIANIREALHAVLKSYQANSKPIPWRSDEQTEEGGESRWVGVTLESLV
jgi:predicted RNase H-like HicB family nuclease